MPNPPALTYGARMTRPIRHRRRPDDALADLRATAQKHDLILLDTRWGGARHEHAFRCPAGHTFTRLPNVLETGSVSCPHCIHLRQAQRLAEALSARGATCATPFAGLKVHHRVTCAKGHTWSVQPRKLLEGSGCPRCAQHARAQAHRRNEHWDRLQAIAAERGGALLSKAYAGVVARYRWRCARGHRWSTLGTHTLSGHWCPTCAHQDRGQSRRRTDTLARLIAAAQERGGACLSTQATTIHATYAFRCAAGHTWTTSGHQVLSGHWCPRCAADRQRRYTTADMNRLAGERGGRCLSETYRSMHTPMSWQCHRGHVWRAVPAHIVYQGAWCPNCFRLQQSRDPIKRLRYDVRG